MVFIDLEKAYDKVPGMSSGGAWRLETYAVEPRLGLERLEETSEHFQLRWGSIVDLFLALSICFGDG
ncbi:hypothetical protein H5410_058936 [Solanum commersonii]|uniref:Uncharacterized protein n=1 Tax=Solanum commersonii TaxID=4109 RepID=A0A9J5W160_SOLCO|nr:hypothetical protein H5410_058936 [Solanum commersonii]